MQAELVWFTIKDIINFRFSQQMKKNSRLLTNFATLLIICMGSLLLYVWIHFDELRSEQAYRQMWYLNHKFENK
ncbi:MAG TPA: hypothetical protein EYO60_04085 [Candidatus Lambdaproteobacteria bacterium]|nr:hypothetical protein [Deltaproteobacteria bacterium]HIB93464.1 hypothetical protein [Candidatus Lambdaproteobacteria bacterium]